MAKKQATKTAEPESEPVIEDEVGGNKSEMIRSAVEAGYTKPEHGVAYIKNHFGADINTKYFSIVKSKMNKSGSLGGATVPSRHDAHGGSESAAAGTIPGNLFDDLKQLRQIKDRYGDDFQKIVDAIG